MLPPDRHRDFPVDTLTSDRTYTIEAWAVNEEREGDQSQGLRSRSIRWSTYIGWCPAVLLVVSSTRRAGSRTT